MTPFYKNLTEFEIALKIEEIENRLNELKELFKQLRHQTKEKEGEKQQ